MKYYSVLLMIVFFLLIDPFSFSSALPDENNPGLKPGSTVFIFGDRVNIRSRPSTGGKKAGLLTIGKKIRIIKKTAQPLKVKGLEDFWYKIKAGALEGYIWGGLLTPYAFEADIDNDGKHETILARNSIRQYPVILIRISKDKRLITEKEVTGDTDIALKQLIYYPGKKFSPPVKLFSIRYSVSYPGIDGEHFFYMNNKKILSAFDVKYNFDMDGDQVNCAGITGKEMIFFPGEREKNINTVIIKSESVCGKEIDRSTENYLWDGKLFKKTGGKEQ